MKDDILKPSAYKRRKCAQVLWKPKARQTRRNVGVLGYFTPHKLRYLFIRRKESFVGSSSSPKLERGGGGGGGACVGCMFRQ